MYGEFADAIAAEGAERRSSSSARDVRRADSALRHERSRHEGNGNPLRHGEAELRCSRGLAYSRWYISSDACSWPIGH